MITGFNKETSDITEAEKKIIPILIKGLEKRVGNNNSITNIEIRNILLKKFNIKISGPRVRKIINHIRITEKVPCLCATSRGYYVAKDEDEMKEYITSLSERVGAQVYLLDKLKVQHERKYPNGIK